MSLAPVCRDREHGRVTDAPEPAGLPRAVPVEARAYPSAPNRLGLWNAVVAALLASALAWAVGSALSLRPWPWIVVGAVAIGWPAERLLSRRLRRPR